MFEDCEALTAWKAHPDTNRAVFDALMSEAMADVEFSATMKVLNVIMADKES